MKRLAQALIVLWVAMLFAAPTLAQGPSTEQIQTWLMSPVVLYVLMLVGSIVSMLKQWGVAKMDGSNVTVGSYLSHIPELLTTLFGNSVAFAGLLMTDTLNFASAIGIGYVMSSISDLNPAGSRSTALK